MPREARRISPRPTGSSYVRALAALDNPPAPASTDDAFAQRLSQWFDWTQAISLSAALGEAPSRSGATLADHGVAERELAQVRQALQAGLAEICGDLAPGFAALRQQVLAWQLAAQARIGPLRRRVRTRLAQGPLARLAQIDAVMEQVIAPREHAALAAAIRRLEPRHRSQPERFALDLKALLIGELELRLQPIEALVAACRPRPSE